MVIENSVDYNVLTSCQLNLVFTVFEREYIHLINILY